MDYSDIDKAFAPLKSKIDHIDLNTVKGLEYPTTEVLSAFLYDNLAETLPQLKWVEMSETHDTYCRYPAT